MSENILEVKGLTKDYGDFVLDKLTFTVPKGVIMGLIGENGAGKSTTINCILNEISKTDGNIEIFGKDYLSEEIEIKDKIGVVFDENHFPDIFTPNEIGTYMSGIYSKWERNTYVNYLSKFELPADKRVKDFSKGMKVKLAFAVALSHKAELLILDEATSGLDPIIRDDILDILIDFVQDENHSVLVSSHIISDLEKVADYITFIHKGKLVFTHSKDELVDNYGVMSCGAMVFDNLDKSEIIAYRKEDAVSLPVSKKQIVCSRYACAGILSLIGFVVALIVNSASYILFPQYAYGFYLLMSCASFTNSIRD